MSALSVVEPIAGEDAAHFRAPGVSIVVTENIAEVETPWRRLEALGTDSPGQHIDFVRSWLDHFTVARENRVFLMAALSDRPVLLLPLYRARSFGLTSITWLTGDHLGFNAPLVDKAAFAAMTDFDRHQIWSRLAGLPFDADVINLPNVPVDLADRTGLSEVFAAIPAADRVHRAQFPDWETCDASQRNKQRRKVDRQQGAKLEALGTPRFEVLEAGDEVDGVIDTMFEQKAARFRQMGIADPFAAPHVRAFYKDVFHRSGGVLHVLRLDESIVAVRYSLAAGEGLHCLISSMTDCQKTQAGSPGKQGLLRIMQGVFDGGHRYFDMGRGENDEKSQWCNVEMPLGHYWRPLSPLGHATGIYRRVSEKARTAIKGNRTWFRLAKQLRKSVAGKRTDGVRQASSRAGKHAPTVR